jgi:DNA-binding response OmpR family regulator
MDPKTWINLDRAVVLLVDGNPQGAQVLRQLLLGFGVRSPIHCSTAADAMEAVKVNEIDLVVANDTLPDMTGFDFVHWLRRSQFEPNSFTSTIIVGGHTKRSHIKMAQDCGANFVITKPISTQVMLERVMWVAKEKRPFLDTGDYLGPDRRFHDLGPPKQGGRRRGDPAPGEGEDGQEIIVTGDEAETSSKRIAGKLP